MTSDQIDELMRDNGIVVVGKAVYALVQLVIAIEREECAKVCEDIDTEYEGEDVLATWCAAAIRART
jgi:hypothetical protein